MAASSSNGRGFWRRRIVDPFVALLRQGITPEKLALSVSLGITLGVTPVLGSTIFLCTLAAIRFRLNLPAIQLVNGLVYPLQLALLIPFLRLGEWITASQPIPISLGRIFAMIRADVWNATTTLWTATLHALTAWAVLAALTLVCLNPVLVVVFRRLQRVAGPHRHEHYQAGTSHGKSIAQ